MGAALLPLALTGMAGSSLISFSQQRSAGKIAQMEAETSAKGEELAALQREADRKSRLAEALATQTAGAGARGISLFEGSPLTVLQESIQAEETATDRDQFNTRLSAMTKRAQGTIARKQINAQAGASLLKGVGGMASLTGLAPAGTTSPLASPGNPLGLTPGQGL